MSMAPFASPSAAGHILLVEDNAEISRMLQQVLSESGFTACGATPCTDNCSRRCVRTRYAAD
jgi:CheY-like chemotaxis protein